MRLCRAFEDCTPCLWGAEFQALVISADVDAPLLEAWSCRMSNRLPFRRGWLPAEWGEVQNPGWLEGNVVQGPRGQLWNILRFSSAPLVGRAAMVRVSPNGSELSFGPDALIDFPGGMTKFTIRRDAASGLFLTLSTNNTCPSEPRQRNVLSLHASPDLQHWRHVATLLEDDSHLSPEDSLRLAGFQYADWQFDGDETIFAVRSAYGAHTPTTTPTASPTAARRTTATCCAEPRRWRRRGLQAAPCTTRPHTHRETRPCE